MIGLLMCMITKGINMKLTKEDWKLYKSNEIDLYLFKLEKEIEKLRENFLKEMNVSKANKLLNEMNSVSEKVLILKHVKEIDN